MKKSLIPMGVAGLLALGATFASQTYAPASVELQPAGGADVEAQAPEDVAKHLLAISAKSGSYYASLEGMPSDPLPTAGMINSMGIDVKGWAYSSVDENNYQDMSRTMTIAQNEKSVVYHIDITQHQKQQANDQYVLQTVSQDVVIAMSRHGMYVKYNDYYNVTETNVKSSSTSQGQTDPTKAISDAIPGSIMANRGKWIYVGIFESRAASASVFDPMAMQSAPMDTQAMANAYIDAMVMQYTLQIATGFKQSFVSTLNTNAKFLNDVGGKLATTKYEQKGAMYEYSMGGTLLLDLTDKAKPIVNYKYNNNLSSSKQDREEERIALSHIDNEAVPVIEKGDIDFYDLIGGAVRDAIAKMPEGSN